jgi:hypothetical protein
MIQEIMLVVILFSVWINVVFFIKEWKRKKELEQKMYEIAIKLENMHHK